MIYLHELKDMLREMIDLNQSKVFFTHTSQQLPSFCQYQTHQPYLVKINFAIFDLSISRIGNLYKYIQLSYLWNLIHVSLIIFSFLATSIFLHCRVCLSLVVEELYESNMTAKTLKAKATQIDQETWKLVAKYVMYSTTLI